MDETARTLFGNPGNEHSSFVLPKLAPPCENVFHFFRDHLPIAHINFTAEHDTIPYFVVSLKINGKIELPVYLNAGLVQFNSILAL